MRVVAILTNNCIIFLRVGLPLCLGGLVTFFAPNQAHSDRHLAYYYAGGIVLFSLLPVCFFHPFIFYIFQMGIKIRVGCSALIYRKVRHQSRRRHSNVVIILSHAIKPVPLQTFTNYHPLSPLIAGAPADKVDHI